MSDVTTFGSLRQRAAIGWLRERDLDLLLCSELHVPGPLREMFAALWGCPEAAFAGAWVSHNDVDGESDLVIAFLEAAALLVFMAENKIAANFQPEQNIRYRARAQRWQEAMPGSRVLTVLLAPREYFSRAGSEAFDRRISYEDLIEALRTSADPRSVFLAEALRSGIAAYRRGYSPVPNEAVTDVWTAVWRLAMEETPLLKMERPEPKPGRSSFIYFRRAAGFDSTAVREAVVVLKTAHGHADLQFGRTSVTALERTLGSLLDEDMSIAKAASSASIRLQVPVVDFGRTPSEQIDAIRLGLQAAERLRGFFLAHQPLELLREHK